MLPQRTHMAWNALSHLPLPAICLGSWMPSKMSSVVRVANNGDVFDDTLTVESKINESGCGYPSTLRDPQTTKHLMRSTSNQALGEIHNQLSIYWNLQAVISGIHSQMLCGINMQQGAQRDPQTLCGIPRRPSTSRDPQKAEHMVGSTKSEAHSEIYKKPSIQ